MLERLRHRVLHLAERSLLPLGRLAQGSPKRLHHECVRLLSQGERPRLTRPTHRHPPAAPEKPTRCSSSPQLAHEPSWGASPAASSSFRRNASALARVAPAGFSSSSESFLHSRLNTPGWGSEVSNSLPTASHARAAASSARASSRRREYPSTVCAPVTVISSPRPSCSSMRKRKNGSNLPPKRLLARRTPLAIALTLP